MVDEHIIVVERVVLDIFKVDVVEAEIVFSKVVLIVLIVLEVEVRDVLFSEEREHADRPFNEVSEAVSDFHEHLTGVVDQSEVVFVFKHFEKYQFEDKG